MPQTRWSTVKKRNLYQRYMSLNLILMRVSIIFKESNMKMTLFIFMPNFVVTRLPIKEEKTDTSAMTARGLVSIILLIVAIASFFRLAKGHSHNLHCNNAEKNAH